MSSKYLYILVSCLIGPYVFSQDLSFSQHYHTSALVNPAAVGNTLEDVKVTMAYKNQWGSVSIPFSSSLFSVEYNLLKEDKKKNHPSFGLIAITDKAGTSGFKSSIYRALTSYHFRLNKTKELSFGVEIGYNQKSYNLEDLAWDSQYNGAGYDPSLPTNENFGSTNSSNVDFGFGAEFRNQNPRKLLWKAGIGAHHYYQEQTVLENGEDQLPTLLQLYFQGQQTNGYMMYRYYAYAISQNISAISGTIGMDVSYRFSYDSKYTNFSTSSAITGGVFYRYRDAVIALVSYEYKRKFRVGMSYDINVSSLKKSSQLNGGPEINLAYLGIFGKKRRKHR